MLWVYLRLYRIDNTLRDEFLKVRLSNKQRAAIKQLWEAVQEECDGPSTLDRGTSTPTRSFVDDCLQGDTVVKSDSKNSDTACSLDAEDFDGTGRGYHFDQNSSEADYQASESSDAGTNNGYSEDGDEEDGLTHKDIEDIIQRAADGSGTGLSSSTLFAHLCCACIS
jgi:hypothetical protein